MSAVTIGSSPEAYGAGVEDVRMTQASIITTTVSNLVALFILVLSLGAGVKVRAR
jgi:hypothetical protein